MEEIWKTVPSLGTKFEASSRGRLRKHLKTRVFYYKLKRRDRYVRINIQVEGERRDLSLHRLVCEAFHGPAPEGLPVARHLDDDPDHNTPDNLAWGSAADNMQDRIRNGKNYWLNRTHCPKGHEYTEENTHLQLQSSGAEWRSCKTCRSELSRKSEERAVAEGRLGEHGTLTRYARGKCRCELCVSRRSEYRLERSQRAKSLELDAEPK